MWYLNNKHAIDKLTVDIALTGWASGLETYEFSYWHEQIKKDFYGDDNNKGIVEEFRDAILKTSESAVAKGNGLLEQNINFMLEECAYTCANFRDIVMVYPMTLLPIKSIIDRYNLNIRQLTYKMSNHSEQHKNQKLDINELNQEIINFITKKADNVNFFIIDKEGNFIYKNDACKKQVNETNARLLNPHTWKTTLEVMGKKQQIIVEEQSTDGHCYAAVKAPMILNNKIAGIIGLAVDITDKKRAEKLELLNTIQQIKLKEQEEFNTFTSRMAHDIRSPLATLGMIAEACKNIPEKEHIALRSVITSIRDIANNLLNKYKEHENEYNSLEENINQKILVNLALSEVISHKKYQYKDINVKFNFEFDQSSNFAFIKCNYSRFSRTISNLINNSVEALPQLKGIVDISLWIDNHNINDDQLKLVV